MTPFQLEHLKLIDAHLERLLAKAEKRTPGKWVAGATIIGNGVDTTVCEMPSREKDSLAWHDNIHFIASCAGNAEAGWRATRAAIALLFAMCDGAHSINTVIAAQKMGESILAAFPLELIQKP